MPGQATTDLTWASLAGAQLAGLSFKRVALGFRSPSRHYALNGVLSEEDLRLDLSGMGSGYRFVARE